MTEIVFFFILAFGILVSAALVVGFKNPIYSALSLIVTFLLVAGTYALLSAPFLALIQVIVCAGAIMVLFVFVIMLLNLGDDELGDRKFSLTKGIAALAGAFVVLALVTSFSTLRGDGGDKTGFPGLSRMAHVAESSEIALADGREVFDEAGQPRVATEQERAAARHHVALWRSFGSVESVGRLVYTKWMFAFQVTGLLLLSAVVGAVVIARRKS